MVREVTPQGFSLHAQEFRRDSVAVARRIAGTLFQPIAVLG